jgi:glutaredoxin-like protein NrdH
MNTLFAPVTVYTKPECRACDRVKSQLNAAGIEYEVVDIMANEDAYSYVKNVLGAKSTPVVLTDNRVILGYDPDALKELIIELNADKIHDHVGEEE